jgi:hypothetical protein
MLRFLFLFQIMIGGRLVKCLEWNIRFIGAMVGGCQLKRVLVRPWTATFLSVSPGLISRLAEGLEDPVGKAY